MDKYYFHYNPKDGKYYVDSNYPIKKSKKKRDTKSKVSSNIETSPTNKINNEANLHIKTDSPKNKLFDSIIKSAPGIIDNIPTILSLVKMLKSKN